MNTALVLRLAALCVIGAVLALFLRDTRPEMEILLTLGVCAAALMAAAPAAEEAMELIQRLASLGGVQEEVLRPLLKTLGITLLCRISASVCRDAGQSAMAAAVELGGALSAVLVSAPLLRMVWELLSSLL